MNEKNILYQGAEAKIYISKYMNFDSVEKRRIPKKYRIKKIDDYLITYRTKEEAKLMIEARNKGVSVPIIYDIDLEKGIIIMEYLRGNRIKDIFNIMSNDDRKKLCIKIGQNIARFHNNNIIHGDITTSNMILVDDRIHFIDFGLGEKTEEVESKGVDLHVLMEAIESTHSKYSEFFKYVLEGYKKEQKNNPNQVIKKIKEIVKRGRYR